MSTLLNLKDMVADQLGSGNGSTSVAKRDRIINRARSQFYSERQWSFLKKTATLTVTDQVASLPADYNKKFKPISVYSYSSNLKYHYTRVDLDDVLSYPEDQFVFALDFENSQIKINQTLVTSVSMDYTYLPADRPISTAEDAQTEPAPDITPIGLLATSMWWLASERSTGKYQLFKDEYTKELGKHIQIDSQNNGIRSFRRPAHPENGYRGGR